jgi:hypothetical protein
MFNGIFIIVGIGCDDVFVFLDAFRQSSYQDATISNCLETRFAWAYNRAAASMLSTSATTALAFGACAFSNIWDIRCFGVVNGFMVVFNYILVITWFPAAVVFYEKYLKNCLPWLTPQVLTLKLIRLVSWMKQLIVTVFGYFRRHFCSFETNDQDIDNDVDDDDDVELTEAGCHQDIVFNADDGSNNEESNNKGDAMFNEQINETRSEDIEGVPIEEDKEYAESKVVANTDDNEDDDAENQNKNKKENEQVVDHQMNDPYPQSSLGILFENFYGGIFADFVITNRKWIVFIFMIFLVASTFVWVMLLRPATKPFAVFDNDHYFTRAYESTYKFAAIGGSGDGGNVMIKIVHGIDRKNPWNAGGTHDTEISTYDLYENTKQYANYVGDVFDGFDYQQELILFCSVFQEQLIAIGVSDVNLEYACWMKDFKKYVVNQTKNEFPVTDRNDFVAKIKSFIVSDETFGWRGLRTSSARRKEAQTSQSDRYLDGDYGALTGFGLRSFNADFINNNDDDDGSVEEADKIYFSFASFQTNLPVIQNGYPNTKLWDLYDKVEIALKATEADITGLQGGFQSCDDYYIMTLTAYLASSAIFNMMTSFCTALVVIGLVTRDVKMAALSGLALYTIVSCVFAEMVALGWSINLLESVDISVAGVSDHVHIYEAIRSICDVFILMFLYFQCPFFFLPLFYMHINFW